MKDKHVATLKLDPALKPKAGQFRFTAGMGTGKTLPAFYKLNGDDLKICFTGESKQRPRNFNSREGFGGRWLLLLKREK